MFGGSSKGHFLGCATMIFLLRARLDYIASIFVQIIRTYYSTSANFSLSSLSRIYSAFQRDVLRLKKAIVYTIFPETTGRKHGNQHARC